MGPLLSKCSFIVSCAGVCGTLVNVHSLLVVRVFAVHASAALLWRRALTLPLEEHDGVSEQPPDTPRCGACVRSDTRHKN
jgi:hypothetical protein